MKPIYIDDHDNADWIKRVSHSVTAAGNADHSDSAMVAWYPSVEEANQLRLLGGETSDHLHCTLVYLGPSEAVDASVPEIVAAIAARFSPFTAHVQGTAIFNTPDGDVLVRLIDAPELEQLQQRLHDEIAVVQEIPDNHGFTAHLTLKYLEPNESIDPSWFKTAPVDVRVSSITCDFGTERTDYKLATEVTLGDSPGHDFHGNQWIGGGADRHGGKHLSNKEFKLRRHLDKIMHIEYDVPAISKGLEKDIVKLFSKKGVWASAQPLELGDVEGHPFHGNQWTSGYSGEGITPEESVRSNPETGQLETKVGAWVSEGTAAREAVQPFLDMKQEAMIVTGGRTAGLDGKYDGPLSGIASATEIRQAREEWRPECRALLDLDSFTYMAYARILGPHNSGIVAYGRGSRGDVDGYVCGDRQTNEHLFIPDGTPLPTHEPSMFTTKVALELGDVTGHDFHGNQWEKITGNEPTDGSLGFTTNHPRYYYHSTKTTNRDSIRLTGLEAGRSLGGKNTRIYLSKDDPQSEPRMDTAPHDTWRVDTSGVPLRPDPELPEQWAIARDSLSPDKLTLVSTTHPTRNIELGDSPGHDFHGNQWVEGTGTESTLSKEVTDWSKQFPKGTVFRAMHRRDLDRVMAKGTLDTGFDQGKLFGATRPEDTVQYLDRNEVLIAYRIEPSERQGAGPTPYTMTRSLPTDRILGVFNPREAAPVSRQSTYKEYPTFYVQQKLELGDVPGHIFHGNQWTGGTGTQPISRSEKIIEQAWPKTDVDLGPADPVVAKGIADHMVSFAKDFPNIAESGFVKRLVVGPGDGQAYAYTLNPRGEGDGQTAIFLNELFYGSSELFGKLSDDDQRLGFHNYDTAQGTLDHELGHVLDLWTGTYASSALMNSTEGGYDEAAIGSLLDGLGRYADDSPLEAVGDAVAQDRLGTDGLSPEMQTIIDTLYEKARGPRASIEDSAVFAGAWVGTTWPERTCRGSAAAALTAAFDPDEARDESGKWTSTGGEPRLAPLESGRGSKNAGKALPFETVSLKGLPEDLRARVMDRVRDRVASTQKINSSFDHYMEVAWNDPATRDAGMTWYQNQHDAAMKIAEENDIEPQNVAAALAAMSPGTQWDIEEPIVRNMASMDKEDVSLSDERLTLLNEKMDGFGLPHVENGDSYSEMDSRSAVITMQSQFMEEDRGTWGVGYGWGGFAKGLDLLRGADPDDALPGAKVRSFTNNIMDPSDPRDVTIDIHMVQGAARDPDVVNDSGVMSSPSYQGASIGAYPYIADVVRRVADDYGVLPNQAQALIWLGYKQEQGASFHGSKGV